MKLPINAPPLNVSPASNSKETLATVKFHPPLENPPQRWSDVIFAQSVFDQAVAWANESGVDVKTEMAKNQSVDRSEAEYDRLPPGTNSREVLLLHQVLHKRLYTNRIITKIVGDKIDKAVAQGLQQKDLQRERCFIEAEGQRLKGLLPDDRCIKDPEKVYNLARDILEALDSLVKYYAELSQFNHNLMNCHAGFRV